MARVQLRGLMKPTILVNGVTDSLAKKERSTTKLVTITKVVGPTTSDAAQALASMLVDQFLPASGSTDFNMAMDTNRLRIQIQMRVETIRASTDSGQKMEREFTLGRTGLCTRAIGDRTKSMEWERTTGWMVELIKVSGKRVRCMALDSTHGKTQSNTKGSTLMTRRRATASTLGRTGVSTRGTGRMENSMDLAN